MILPTILLTITMVITITMIFEDGPIFGKLIKKSISSSNNTITQRIYRPARFGIHIFGKYSYFW